MSEAVEAAAASLDDIVDCGTVTAADGPSAWSEMQACILDAAERQQAYKAFAHDEEGITLAFGSTAGADYTHHSWLTAEWLDAIVMAQCPEPTVEVSNCEPSATRGTCIACIGEGNPGNVVCPADAAPDEGTSSSGGSTG